MRLRRAFAVLVTSTSRATMRGTPRRDVPRGRRTTEGVRPRCRSRTMTSSDRSDIEVGREVAPQDLPPHLAELRAMLAAGDVAGVMARAPDAEQEQQMLARVEAAAAREREAASPVAPTPDAFGLYDVGNGTKA